MGILYGRADDFCKCCARSTWSYGLADFFAKADLVIEVGPWEE